jgi:Lon-like ATP-dependent protease
LSLIEDPASKEKVRKEIDRWALVDKHSSEFSKINAYLDEIFSIPWKKFTVIENIFISIFKPV